MKSGLVYVIKCTELLTCNVAGVPAVREVLFTVLQLQDPMLPCSHTSPAGGIRTCSQTLQHGQLTTPCMQVDHPSQYEGAVTVSLPGMEGVVPLRYHVVNRTLAVQGLGFSLGPGGM